jgi:hypothetical protein
MAVGYGCVNEIVLEEPTPAKRTVLAYIAGDNSLSGYAMNNLSSILVGSAGSLNGGNLLIYIDTQNSYPCLIRIKEGLYGAEMDTVKIYDAAEEQNSASIETMKMVLGDVFHNPKYDAPSKGLILWSHGTAWLPQSPRDYLRAIIQDKTADGEYWLMVNDLRDALYEYRNEDKFDFIVFDACYMASVEVFYALRDNADYIMASPTEVLAEGLPYRQIIKNFFAEEPVEDILKSIASAFYEYYNKKTGYEQSASIALARTGGFAGVAALSREILNGKYTNEVYNVPLANILTLDWLTLPKHGLFDFKDFVSHIATDEQFGRFAQAMDELIIYKETTPYAYYVNPQMMYPMEKERFCGISSYIPQRTLSSLNDWYKCLDWYKAVYE